MQSPMRDGTYEFSSGFGPRWGTFHRGVDFSADLHTRIYAAEAGAVADSRDGVGGFECWIIIDHVINGKKYSTVYGHMPKYGLLVDKGDRVVAGQLIGLVGNEGDSTGPHLHAELWEGGRLTGGKAIDPAPWFGLTPFPAEPSATLQLGSQGEEVLSLQNFMTRAFASYNRYVPDGYFGPITELGVMEFQRRSGLEADGVVGPGTKKEMAKYGYK